MNDSDLRKITEGLTRCFDSHDAAALVHVAPLAEMLNDDPNKAIDLIVGTCERALNDAYSDENGKNVRWFVQSLAGGPCEIVPSAIYNAVGAVYPYLEREQKDRALGKVLYILDRLNYTYVQDSHTPFIREPLLISDIFICRGVYWPGYGHERKILEGFSSFDALKEKLIDERGMFKKNVRSDFLMALALMNRNYSAWSESYVGVAQPEFLERVFQGVIAADFSRLPEAKMEETKKLFEKTWPKTLYDRIDGVLEKKDWVDYKKF